MTTYVVETETCIVICYVFYVCFQHFFVFANILFRLYNMFAISIICGVKSQLFPCGFLGFPGRTRGKKEAPISCKTCPFTRYHIEQASLCTAAPGFWTNSGHCAASVCNMVLGLHKNGRVFSKARDQIRRKLLKKGS